MSIIIRLVNCFIIIKEYPGLNDFHNPTRENILHNKKKRKNQYPRKEVVSRELSVPTVKNLNTLKRLLPP